MKCSMNAWTMYVCPGEVMITPSVPTARITHP